jgi:hypothetical protein
MFHEVSIIGAQSLIFIKKCITRRLDTIYTFRIFEMLMNYPGEIVHHGDCQHEAVQSAEKNSDARTMEG